MCGREHLVKCLIWYVTPVWIRRQVHARRPKAPTGIEKALVKVEIDKEQDVTTAALRDYRQLLVNIKKELSFFDWLRFCKFINKTTAHQVEQRRQKIDVTIVTACPTIRPIISFNIRHTFRSGHKDILPTTSESHVVFKFECCCEKQYVDKTTEVLSERISQHVPNKLVEAGPTTTRKVGKKDSAITKHLSESPACLQGDPRQRFTILSQARDQLHLDFLEAIFIRRIKPDLCIQKEFTRTLQLV